jgi:hypothetical protein
VLRGIFVPKRDEVTGGWGKLYKEVLRNLYSSLNIMRMIKSRRVGWAWHVECMNEEECLYDFGGIARSKETTRKINT